MLLESNQDFDLRISKLSARLPKTGDNQVKERTDKLVERWIKILGDHQVRKAYYSRQTALLLLGELGPQAKAAVPKIREVMAEDDVRLKRVAAFALTRIEK